MREPTLCRGNIQVVFTQPALIVANPPFVIQPPTLMLEKMCETYEVTFSLLTNIPGAKLVILAACGHLPQPEQPQATADALVEWLRN